jgi:hypothetical protein
MAVRAVVREDGRCRVEARGVWIDLICMMRQEASGTIECRADGLARAVGLDVERFFDTLTSDVERIALVRNVVTSIPGVTGITAGPTLTRSGSIYFVEVSASTSAGNFTIATQV